MDNWITLVKQQMRVQRITQEKLAERIGATQGAVNHWLGGRRQPDINTMNRVLQALGLATMEVARVLRVQEDPPHYAPDVPTGALPGEGYRYPCLHWHAVLQQGERCSERWLFSGYRAKGLAYWLQVEGDAMTAPLGWSVSAGMWVLVDTGLVHQPGDLVVVASGVGEEVLFRQWVQEAGRLYLRPLNPNWPTLPAPEPVQVEGVVVEAMMELLTARKH